MARPQQTSTEAILDSLAAHPEVTVADLADVLGIGRSTVAKRLDALETVGSVRRIPGGRVRGARVADRWSMASAPDTVPSGTGESRTNATETAPPGSSTPETAVSDSGTEHGGSGRLARGELGTLVRKYLSARPGEDFGPSAVGKALGRSQGAVSNSLATMAARGEVELVGDKPRRYRIAG
jgi:DNA-binding transcriptional ArsR family regulator